MSTLKCPECDSFINASQLKNDNCWSCGKDISTIKPNAENHETNTKTMGEVEEKVKSKEINNKYPALKTISGFYSFIAFLSIIGAIIGFFYGSSLLDSYGTETQGIILMISSIIYGIIAYLISKAFAEGILLFIDVANDLRELKTHLVNND